MDEFRDATMKVRFAARNAAFWSKVDSMALRSSTSLVSGRTTFLLRGELSIRCRSIVCLTRFETLLAYSRPCSSSNSRSRRAQTPPRRHRQCVSSQIAAERDARWIQVERQQWAGVMSPPAAPPPPIFSATAAAHLQEERDPCAQDLARLGGLLQV